MKSVLLLVPDGIGIKNYLYSDVFKNSVMEVSLFHNFDDDTLSHISEQLDIKASVVIPKYKENIKEKYLRELIHLSRLKYNAQKVKNPTILKFWKRGHKSLKLKLFYGLITMIANFKTSYKSIEKLEQRYNDSLRKNLFYNQVTKLLKQQRPSQLFCTHQRALVAPTIFAAANDLGIPTTTVIYSWDNIPKARLALKANNYLVWSEYMKKELILLYPEIPSEKIIVTGTPQFEFYKNPDNIINKEAFFTHYGLDVSKKLICFSGDDIRTSPYDPEYLNDVATEITKAGLDASYQIIFRRCPVDVSGRYDWVVEKFPKLIIEIPPLWNYNSKKWTAVYPTIEDVKLLVSLAYYANVVINVGSTMAFDFGMFNKPCVYINYDHIKDQYWSVDTIYKYQHFRSMPSQKAVYWFNNKTEIPEVITTAVAAPNTEIGTWYSVVNEHTVEASKNIFNTLA